MSDNQLSRLKKYQNENRLTGDELAILLGVSRSLLTKVSTGNRNMSSKLSKKIEDFLSTKTTTKPSSQLNEPKINNVKTPESLGVITEISEEYINKYGNKFTRVDGQIIVEVPLLIHQW